MVRANPVIAVAKIGLTPIFPLIFDVPVVEIPVFARIAKLHAVPRSKVEGVGAPITPGIVTADKRQINIMPKVMEKIFLSRFLKHCIVILLVFDRSLMPTRLI
jgi:hypothetical protein